MSGLLRSNKCKVLLAKLKGDGFILTAKLGDEIINCYDGKLNKDTLKKWSSKGIIKCPACGERYVYNHGQIRIPYFKHINAECSLYGESETEEHFNGKRDLYEWISKQENVSDCILEGWLPDTKQRPDIMFKYNGKQYVIEFQCTPISSEYIERHNLYISAGINDIWICGTDKYFGSNMRKKYLQDVSVGFYSVYDKHLILTKNNSFYIRTQLKQILYKSNFGRFHGVPLDYYKFDNEIYDHRIGKTDEAILRHENRRKNYGISKCKNRFLNMQQDRLEKLLSTKLSDLSNENWVFYIIHTESKYKMFDYIIAEPRASYDVSGYDFNRDFRKKKYSKLKLYNIDFDVYKKYARDDNFLKTELSKLMMKNKEELLKYSGGLIRFLEVNKNS